MALSGTSQTIARIYMFIQTHIQASACLVCVKRKCWWHGIREPAHALRAPVSPASLKYLFIPQPRTPQPQPCPMSAMHDKNQTLCCVDCRSFLWHAINIKSANLPKLSEQSHFSGIKIKFCQGESTFFNCTLVWSALSWNCWNRHVLTCKPFDLPNQTSMLREQYAPEASKYFQTVRATFLPSPPHSWLNCPWEAWLFHKIRHHDHEVPYLLPASAYCPQSPLDFEWPKLKQNWRAAWWVAKCLNLSYISLKWRPPNATIAKLTIQSVRADTCISFAGSFPFAVDFSIGEHTKIEIFKLQNSPHCRWPSWSLFSMTSRKTDTSFFCRSRSLSSLAPRCSLSRKRSILWQRCWSLSCKCESRNYLFEDRIARNLFSIGQCNPRKKQHLSRLSSYDAHRLLSTKNA